ncbi:MAG: tRNA (adenosine(37)-N6)-threonylcarbamoyltransferase complex ATPase subunit type 1 TsaE [Deltaproteobacteria bacterium]|nr:tRNA (adenosine(37)-N6)-threonylcarbamoyltransferase complex ATPase subunit type 1 TsaE [Candidatus Anaeroferrophillus wilburensis]MBN2888279.1 tRNA (adenosine(37)-N6)-threonylcarbamoyltransferase complex ATPase subunit type 1 TsaE [Deltaproteobacteria bacterium]
MSNKEQIISSSPDETIRIGEQLSCSLTKGLHIFTLHGTLGAGKTLLTKGIARGLNVGDWYYVNSPTFTLINEYEGRLPLYHFDLYRLGDSSELLEIGFEEYLQQSGVMVIEWPEKIGGWLPADRVVRIYLQITGEQQREIIIVRDPSTVNAIRKE